MSRPGGRPKWQNGLLGLTVVLAMAVPLPFSHTAKSQAASIRTDTASSGPSKAQRIKVLTAALKLMHKNFANLSQFTPSAQDVFDYQVGDLWKQGIDGTGTTVAVMEGWNDPKIGQIMAGFDQQLGLPKAQFKTIYPTGLHKLPKKCPPGMVKLQNYGSCDGWAGELELDVASVHLMAPYAKILIVVAPPDSEITDVGPSSCNPNLVTKSRATAAWDDSPWVTAVGGTIPAFTSTGQRAGDDPVWNLGPEGLPFGEGAGFSVAFGRPSYMNDVAKITKSGERSVPDISLDGSSGTSESGPLLAGILALATQIHHHLNVGPINPLLYGVLGPAGLKGGIADVVSGNNDVIRNGKVAVKGFAAAKGYDIASGWGTVRANTFAPALAKAATAAHDNAAARSEAAKALLRLVHQVSLTKTVVRPSGSTKLTARGFLAGHPVVLAIDDHKIATLKANSQGTVTFTIKPAALHLGRGRHIISLASMLITSTDSFRVS